MSFIKTNYIITKLEYQFLSNLKLTKEQRELLLHCLKSSIYSLKECPYAEGYFPLPSLTIQNAYGTKYLTQVVQPLLDLGYIQRNNYYNIVEGICMHYKAEDKILTEFRLLNKQYLKQLESLSWVSSRTGKANTKRCKQSYRDKKDTRYPKLIREGLENISRAKFNIEELINHLNEQESDLSNTNDINCLLSLFNKEAIYNSITNELEYRAVYEPKFAGRIYELDGGTQTMSRLSRHILMHKTPDFYNYDLKSSQIYSLMDLFEEAGIPTDWLETYLSQPKEVFAQRCNLSVDTWKACLMALIMGAELPTTKQIDYSSISERKAIFNTIRENSNSLLDTINSLFAFTAEVKELNEQLNKWHQYLLEVKVPQQQFISNNKLVVVNKTGKAFILSDYLKKGKYIKRNELKRKLAAFYLQGYESCFIYHIHNLSKTYGYKVIGNYHDGVTTIGKIPQEAIEEARYKSGVKYAQLEIKPIV